jgi:VanZ family protein
MGLVILWTIVLAWMAVIFYFSSQPAEVSNRLSTSVAEVVVRVAAYVLPIEIEVSTGIISVDGLNSFLRKLCHFTLYLILSLLVVHAVVKSGMYGFKAMLAALLFCVVTAAADEVFQSFVPGRGGQVSDVFIDSAGALLGLSIYFVATRGMRVEGRN